VAGGQWLRHAGGNPRTARLRWEDEACAARESRLPAGSDQPVLHSAVRLGRAPWEFLLNKAGPAVVVVNTRQERLTGTALRLHLRAVHLLCARLCSLGEKSLEDVEEGQAMKARGLGSRGAVMCAAVLGITFVLPAGEANPKFPPAEGANLLRTRGFRRKPNSTCCLQ